MQKSLRELVVDEIEKMGYKDKRVEFDITPNISKDDPGIIYDKSHYAKGKFRNFLFRKEGSDVQVDAMGMYLFNDEMQAAGKGIFFGKDSGFDASMVIEKIKKLELK